jgi:predicted metal-dependent HD superfamily phosphohydrolase
LLRRYAQPHRCYHDLRHLVEVLDAVDELGGSDDARLAAWFHDAVYLPAAPDNEARSADLAREAAGERAAALVLATARHEPGDDPEAAVLCDADLAVLASPRRRYDRYAADIRAEYAAIPDEAFRAGRGRMLRGFLDRPRIYTTAGARRRWEDAARANLSRELAALAEPGAARPR